MATTGKKRKGHSGEKKNAIYKMQDRKTVNKNKRLRRQLKKHPDDTTNPLHKDYVKCEAHTPHKVMEPLKRHHRSVFDGRLRKTHKNKRKPTPLRLLKEVPLVIKKDRHHVQ